MFAEYDSKICFLWFFLRIMQPNCQAKDTIFMATKMCWGKKRRTDLHVLSWVSGSEARRSTIKITTFFSNLYVYNPHRIELMKWFRLLWSVRFWLQNFKCLLSFPTYWNWNKPEGFQQKGVIFRIWTTSKAKHLPWLHCMCLWMSAIWIHIIFCLQPQELWYNDVPIPIA